MKNWKLQPSNSWQWTLVTKSAVPHSSFIQLTWNFSTVWLTWSRSSTRKGNYKSSYHLKVTGLQSCCFSNLRQPTSSHLNRRNSVVETLMNSKFGQYVADFTALQHTQKTRKKLLPLKSYGPPTPLQATGLQILRPPTPAHLIRRNSVANTPMNLKLGHSIADFSTLQLAKETLQKLLPIKSYGPSKLLSSKLAAANPLVFNRP